MALVPKYRHEPTTRYWSNLAVTTGAAIIYVPVGLIISLLLLAIPIIGWILAPGIFLTFVWVSFQSLIMALFGYERVEVDTEAPAQVSNDRVGRFVK